MLWGVQSNIKQHIHFFQMVYYKSFISNSQPLRDASGNDFEDADIDYHIVGTSTDLVKPYLRLTSVSVISSCPHENFLFPRSAFDMEGICIIFLNPENGDASIWTSVVQRQRFCVHICTNGTGTEIIRRVHLTKRDFELYIISIVSFSVKHSQVENRCQHSYVVSCGCLSVPIFQVQTEGSSVKFVLGRAFYFFRSKNGRKKCLNFKYHTDVNLCYQKSAIFMCFVMCVCRYFSINLLTTSVPLSQKPVN